MKDIIKIISLFFCLVVMQNNLIAAPVTLDQATLITGGMRLCDQDPETPTSYCVDITSTEPPGTEGATFNAAIIPPLITSTGAGNVSTTELVILNYDTSTSPIAFTLQNLSIQEINSLTPGNTSSPDANGCNTTGVRDSYAWSADGTWTLDSSGGPRGAIVSVVPGAINGGVVDDVGVFEVDDSDNVLCSDTSLIGDFILSNRVAGTIPFVSDVLLNMAGVEHNHNVEYALTTPSTSANLYVFNAGLPGASSMGWNFSPSMTVNVPGLTLIKEVDNNLVGTASPSDWTLSAVGPETLSGTSGVNSKTITPGTYTLSESGGPGAYTYTDLSCVNTTSGGTNVSGVTTASPSVTIATGDDITCTFTNEYTVPTASCPASTVLTSQTGNAVGNAGFNNVTAETQSEDLLETVGTTASISNSTELTLSSSFIDLDLGAGNIVPQNGILTVSIARDTNAALVEIFTSTDDISYTSVGTYGNGGSLNTPGPLDKLERVSFLVPNSQGARYIRFDSQNASDMFVDGVEYSQICASPTASLTIVKDVVNDNGGTATVTDFAITTDAGTLMFDGGTTTATDTITYTATVLSVAPGTYTLVETDVASYAEGIWVCMGAAGVVVDTFNAGSVEIADGETVTCTISNNDLGSADLSVVKAFASGEPSTYASGDTVTYTITISNAGPDTATNVVVTDLPTNLTVTSATGPNTSCTIAPAAGVTTSVDCTIASLAVGDGASETITIKANAP